MIAVDLDVVGEHTSYVASDNIGGARLAVAATPLARAYTDRHDRRPRTHQSRAPTARWGYRLEMRELGLEILPGYEFEGDFYAESGERRWSRCSPMREPPTAVFAAADMMAVGAIRTAQAAGCPCPATSPSWASTTADIAEMLSPRP